MLERRRIPRTRVLKGAKIILNSSSSLFDCTALNLTTAGSCLQLPSSLGVPISFALSFDHARTRRPCHVIWRTENKLGVSFD